MRALGFGYLGGLCTAAAWGLMADGSVGTAAAFVVLALLVALVPTSVLCIAVLLLEDLSERRGWSRSVLTSAATVVGSLAFTLGTLVFVIPVRQPMFLVPPLVIGAIVGFVASRGAPSLVVASES